MNCPVWIPSAAMKSSVLFLKRYGSRKATLAKGAPRPGSWMISWEGRPPKEKDVTLSGHQPTHGLWSAPTGCWQRHLTYLYNPLDVAMTFSEVNVTEFSSTFSVLDVGFEHGARTFSLSPDHTSHRVLKHRQWALFTGLTCEGKLYRPLTEASLTKSVHLFRQIPRLG